MSRPRRRPLVVLALTLLVSVRPAALAAGTPGAEPPRCGLDALPGLRRQFTRAVSASAAAGRAAGASPSPDLGPVHTADFWRVAQAVLGPGADALIGVVSPDAVVGLPPPALEVTCTPDVRGRDAQAWRMGLGGYSAREIADVLNGHLTRADLDQARRQLMAGEPAPRVAAFLEGRWRQPAALPQPAPPARMDVATLGELERDLDALARQHRVAPALVRAVIAAESAGNAAALSSAGAIGLMQLMPGTAASLGVDPWQPRENLRGGIVYLASLLRAFDENARLALIAYNAGPEHARHVRDGRAVAYRETRRYLDAVDARYRLSR